MRKYQILIVSAVKNCKQRLKVASAFWDFVPQIPYRGFTPNLLGTSVPLPVRASQTWIYRSPYLLFVFDHRRAGPSPSNTQAPTSGSGECDYNPSYLARLCHKLVSQMCISSAKLLLDPRCSALSLCYSSPNIWPNRMRPIAVGRSFANLIF